MLAIVLWNFNTLSPHELAIRREKLCTHLPKLYKVLQRCGGNKYTIDKCICQKQHEEFVVMEAYTIVHPWTMVIHL